MTDAYRTIAVFADGTLEGQCLFTQAARLARRAGAGLIAVHGGERTPITPAESFTRGLGAIADVLERHSEADRAKAAEVTAPLRAIASAMDLSCDFRTFWSDGGADGDALRFLDCDLMVAAHPTPPGLPAAWAAERLLRLNGGPLLLVPTAWSGEYPGRHVVIAWNGSRQARRAVTDALPFIKAAAKVTILVVDAERCAERAGAEPGEDMAAYLQRFGIAAGLHRASSGGATIASTIVLETGALNADLVVIGCYSRSRTLETIFGGVTRTLLHDAPVPLLLSF